MTLIEIFRSDCEDCDKTIELLMENRPNDCKCDFRIYNLATICGAGDCGCGCSGILPRLKKYEIKVIPSVIMNDELVLEGKLTKTQVEMLYQNFKCGK